MPISMGFMVAAKLRNTFYDYKALETRRSPLGWGISKYTHAIIRGGYMP